MRTEFCVKYRLYVKNSKHGDGEKI